MTVRPVKYGISSLVDFVSERLHCQLVLCACLDNTSCNSLWKLSWFHGVKRSLL